MNVVAKILATEKFAFNGNNFVKLQGFINGLGVFQQTVKEDLVPDSLEGKEVTMMFSIGVDSKLKPYLKLKGISLDTSIPDENNNY